MTTSLWIGVGFVLSLTFILHLFNTGLIIRRRSLHKPSYYILLHLFLSDTLFILTMATRTYVPQMGEVGHAIQTIFLNASIFTTLGLTIDRYIAVEHCLRYGSIVTKRALWRCGGGLWLSSVLLEIVPRLGGKDPEERNLFSEIVHIIVNLLVSLVLITCSLYVRKVRNGHETNINKLTIRFGIHAERLNHLKRLSSSVVDVLKLNMVTSVLIVAGNVSFAFAKYGYPGNKILGVIVRVVIAVYVISNPVVYACTLSKLKKEYVKLFRKSTDRRVST